jgi:hypothetical protein
LAGGAAAGLPVLVTTTSSRAVADLAGRVSVVLIHRLADPATADILAARTGTKLVPAGWCSGKWAATALPAAGMQPAVVMPPTVAAQSAAAMSHAGFFQSPASMLPGVVIQPGVGTQPGVTVHPGVAVWPNGAMQPVEGIQPAMGMPHMGAMPSAASAALPAAGLVPVPAVPARTLLSLGPAEFVLAVNSPRYWLVKLARAVPARLPRGAMP